MWKNIGNLARTIVAPDDAYSSDEWESEGDESFDDENDDGYQPPPTNADATGWEREEEWHEQQQQQQQGMTDEIVPSIPGPAEPDDGWDDDDNGWNEDSFLNEDNTNSETAPTQQQSAVIEPPMIALPPSDDHLPIDETVPNEQTEGWNDDSLGIDDSLSAHPLPVLQQQPSTGWNDDSLHLAEPRVETEASLSQQQEETAEGWNDDSLEFGDSSHHAAAVFVPAETRSSEPLLQTSSPPSSPQKNENGWNDDSLTFFDDTVLPLKNESPAGTANIEPPSAVPQSTIVVESKPSPSAAAMEPNPAVDTIQEGWGDDDLLEDSSSSKQALEQPVPTVESPSGIAELPDDNNDDDRLERTVTTLSEENEVLKRELRSLQNDHDRLQLEVQEQVSASQQVSQTHKQAVSILESQLEETIQDKENNYQTMVATQRELERAQAELNVLRQSSEPVVDQVLKLQQSHEETLQRQYDMLDKKSARIRELEHYCRNAELEKTTFAEESLSVQHDLREQSEQLAAELLSVVQERDLLNHSLHDNAESMRQLHQVIESQGMDVSARHERLLSEKEELETQLQDFVEESESIKETLKEVKLENGRLVQQLEDVTFESETLKEDLRKAKLENANLRASNETNINVEQLTRQHEELQYELEQVEADFRAQLASKEQETLERIQRNTEAVRLEKETLQSTLNKETDRLNYEISRLQTELETATGVASASAQECTALLERIQLLSQEKEALEGQIRDSRSEFESKLKTMQVEPSSTAEDIQLEKDRLEEDLKELQAENSSLRTRIESTEASRGDLAASLEEIQSQLDERDCQIADYQQEISSLTAKADDANQSLQSKLAVLQTERDSLVAQVETLVAANSAFEKDLQSRSQRFEEAENLQSEQIDQLRLENRGLSELKTQAEAWKRDNERMQEELRSALTNGATEAARLSAALNDRNQELNSTRSTLAELHKENARLRVEAETVPDASNFDDALEDLQLEKDLLDDEIEELRTENETLRSDLERYRMQGADGNQAEIQQRELAEATEVTEARREEMASLSSEIRELKAENESLCANAESYREVQERLASAEERIRLEADDLRRAIEQSTHLKMQLHDAQTEIERLNAQLEASESSLANSNSEMLAVAERQMQGHALLVEELEHEKESLLASLSRLQSENVALKAEVEQLAEAPVAEKDQLEDYQLEKDHLEDALEELRLENKSLTEQLERALVSQSKGSSNPDDSRELNRIRASLEELQAEKQVADTELSKKVEEAASLTNQLKCAQKELQLVSTATHEQRKEADRQLQIQIEELKSQVNEKLRIIESQCGDVERLKAESEVLASNVAEKDKELSTVRSLLEQSEVGLQHREEALENSRASHTKAMEDLRILLEEDVQELRKENAALLEQLQHVKEPSASEYHVPADSAMLEDIQLEKDLLEDDIAQLRKENSALQQQLEQANASAPSDTVLEDLQLEKDLLEDDIAVLQRENAALQEQIKGSIATDEPSSSTGESQLQQELARVQAEYLSLKANYDNVSTDLMSREMEIEDLQEQLASGEPGFGIQNPSADLHAEVDRLREERSAMLQTVEALKSDAAVRESTNGSMEKELTRLQAEVGDISAENERLRQQLQNSADVLHQSSRVAELSQEVETLAARYSEAETQRKQSTSHLAALGKTLKRAEAAAEEQKDRASSLESELASARSELEASADTNAKANNMISELERKCAELEATLSRSKDEFETSMSVEISQLTSRCRDLQDEANRYREMEGFAAQQLEQAEEAARQHVQAITNQINDLTAECERLQKELQARNELDAATQTASSTAQSLQAECDQLHAEVLRLQEIESKVESNVAYEERIAWTEKELSARSEEVVHLEDQVAKYEEQVQTLRQESNDNAQHYNEECGRLQDSLDAATHALEQHQREISNLEQQVNSLNAECTGLREEASAHGHIARELDEQRARLADLLRDRDAVNTENEELLVQFGLVKQQMDSYEAYIANLRDDIDNRQISNAGASGDIMSDLSSRYRELETKCRDQEEQISRFMESGVDSTGNEHVAMVEELLERCRELEAELDSTKTRLESTEASLAAKEQLVSFQAAVSELDNTVQRPGQISRLVADSENYLEESHTELELLAVDELHERSNGFAGETKTESDDLQPELVHEESKLDPQNVSSASVVNLEDLRGHIVSLAMALERSENSRADALHRLVSEREMHAKSLRCMSDNVKRFYSTVTFTDA